MATEQTQLQALDSIGNLGIVEYGDRIPIAAMRFAWGNICRVAIFPIVFPAGDLPTYSHRQSYRVEETSLPPHGTTQT
jgi:hypothetical protein